ncbi:hypothetical protein [Psychromonas sp. SP041]|uniref:hypothetical protein n=1 Tax=Psychromonas sp. SP041 TaxID=1365007 RepID=UPI0010C78AD3|nr:hypothetical protein [Psychromonas sp. SP041]
MKSSKNLITIALASILMSMTANAASTSDFLGEVISDNEGKVSVKESNNKTKVTEKTDKLKHKEKDIYSNAEAFIDPKISASRSAETSRKQHELEMLQLDMSALEVQDAIYKIKENQSKLKVEAMVKEQKELWEKEKAELISDYEAQIDDLKLSIEDNNKKVDEQMEVNDFLKEKLFVTKTSGIGTNKSAQFYFENNIADRGVGEEIIPGAIVTKVNTHGAEVSYKGKVAFLSITTKAFANSKTISREELEYQKSLEEAKLGIVKAPSDIGSVPPMPR